MTHNSFVNHIGFCSFVCACVCVCVAAGGMLVSMHEETPEVSYYPVSLFNSTSVFVLPATDFIRLHGK